MIKMNTPQTMMFTSQLFVFIQSRGGVGAHRRHDQCQQGEGYQPVATGQRVDRFGSDGGYEEQEMSFHRAQAPLQALRTVSNLEDHRNQIILGLFTQVRGTGILRSSAG
jgi:hypothetical protein